VSVLLLRLAGPMQSWGTRSRFSNRDTGLEPSRSGAIGLLCAALGIPRDDDEALKQFAVEKLPMAVRVDREGRLMRDYHTAQEVMRASGKSTQETVLSERFYLADADFLVGLGGDRPFLDRLAAALAEPKWQLSLGRKAFVPGLPVCEGVVEGELPDVLAQRHWRRRWANEKPPEKLRYVVEVAYGKGEPRQDVPVSFVSRDRKFAVRHVETKFLPLDSSQILDPDTKEPPCS
jgi:CRISPR system Cascade subunit CasD